MISKVTRKQLQTSFIMTQCGLLMCWLEMAHGTLTRQKSPAMCNRQVLAMPPKHSFQGVKKKSHNKVDILSRGVLKVVCSMWPAMASKQGHLKAPHYRGIPHLRLEFRCQYALVREAERSKVGRSEAPGGRAQQLRAVAGHRVSGATSPTPAVFSSLILCLGPRGRRRGQTLAIGSGEQRGRPAGCSNRAGSVI